MKLLQYTDLEVTGLKAQFERTLALLAEFNFRKLCWSLLRVALGAFTGLCLLLYFGQSRLVYFPTRAIEETPAGAGLAFEELRLTTRDGATLGAWYVPAAATNSRRAILLCHGNGGNIGHRVEAIRFFHSLGLQVLIFDYRGYGSSSGTPSEEGTYQDARAAWDHLVQVRDFAPAEIVVYGRSLGGSVATWLAEQVHPGALIIEASFTSLPAMAARLYPVLPTRWLCRFRYDSLERLPRVTCPVLVAHSRADEMIPFAMGEQLFQAALPPKRFVTLRGSHNYGEGTLPPAYENALRAFLALPDELH
jgi:fermentation-respiration switch protein FrsA (DUF1100 family)